MKLTCPRIILYSLTLLLVLLLACADDMPPPGGEIDKASPYLIGSVPMTGAIDVPSGNTVILYFSEQVARPPVGQTIFISPRPAIEPKIKWSSDRVTIIFADSFKVDQTYIISAGTQVKDLRGNQLDSALTIAFSTGQTIAEGRTAGLITNDKGQPQSGLLVGLYDPTTLDTALAIDSIYPSYVIPTNSEGLFNIGYLPNAEFRMIAFKDINNNGRFNPGKEPFALPDRRIVTGESTPIEDLMLTLQVEDTTSAEILAVSQTSDGLLRLRLSRSIDLKQLHQNPERCVLNLVGDTATTQELLLGELSSNLHIVFPSLALLEDDSAQVSVINFVPGVFADGEYSVTLTYDSTLSPISFPNVQMGSVKDENAPTLTQISPGNQPQFAEEVKIDLTFSEPLDTSLITPETFLLKLVSDSLIPITSNWLDPLRLRLTPEALFAGGRYQLSITEFELADKAGNRLGDSLRVHYFNVIDSDSLGSISGETLLSIAGKERDFVHLTFQKVGGRAFDFTTPAGTFNIELPGGKYVLSGFIDSDNDSVKGVGSVNPYKLGETMATYPDTISVRTRFETAGIQFEFR